MPPSPEQIQDELERRAFAKYILRTRLGRGFDQYFSTWKDQIDTNDRMYSGDWSIEWPDGIVEQARPIICNLTQTAVDDFGRLVMEVQPQIRCSAHGDADIPQKKAAKREAILITYNEENDVEEENHWLALDLAQTGIALEAVTFDGVDMNEEGEYDDQNYPVYTRINPRGAFPRFVGNKLVDLIVVQRMEKELVGPAFDIDLAEHFDGATLGKTKEVEVIDYFDSKSFSRVLVAVSSDNSAATYGAPRTQSKIKGAVKGLSESSDTSLVSRWDHNLGKPCVAWSRLKTGDGAFRGFFDQLKGATLTQNRILNLLITGAEQGVYAPFEEYDVENPNDPPGPKTVYHLRSADGKMGRVAPSTASPEINFVLSYLERQARAGANYPESRTGEVGQSIASASFVNATMGNLTTLIKGGQKELARLWMRRNSLALEIDKKFCTPGPKPLCIASGSFSDYSVSDIDSFKNLVVYGAGAGLDALNKKAAIANDVNLGIASKKTAREQTDYLQDEIGEAQQIAKEKTEDAILQRLLTDPNIGMAMLMNFAQLLSAGKDPLEAAAILASMAEQQQQEAQQVQTGAGGPSAPGTPMQPPVGMQNQMAPPSPSAPVPSAARAQASEVRGLPSMEGMVAAAQGGG